MVECCWWFDERLFTRMLSQHFVEHEVTRFEIFEHLYFVDWGIIHSCNELAYILSLVTFLQRIELGIVFLPLLYATKTLLDLFLLLISILHSSSCLSHFRGNMDDLLVACEFFQDAIFEKSWTYLLLCLHPEAFLYDKRSISFVMLVNQVSFVAFFELITIYEHELFSKVVHLID